MMSFWGELIANSSGRESEFKLRNELQLTLRWETLSKARGVSIIEDDDGVFIEIKPAFVRYEFENWDEAIEALPNLPETEKDY